MPDNLPQLSLAPLKKAVGAFREAIQDLSNPKYRKDYMRDAVIQRFEFSFELAWKSIQRFLQLNQRPVINNIKDILREAGKLQLIDSVEAWFEFQRARNITSHAYGERVAEEIVQIAVRFLPEVEKLIESLDRAND